MAEGEKRCWGCQESRPLSAFHHDRSRSDGHQGRCKDCMRERERIRRRNPVKRAEAQARYAKRYPERATANSKRFRERRPDAARAHSAVRNALRSGALIRPERCEECTEAAPLEGHHYDYSKPLDVRWLCRRCHLAEHGKELRRVSK